MKPNWLTRAKVDKRADQADVRALRRLDRAHPAVVAEVHVADLEPGALAAEATRTERRQAAAVGDARQRVHLVHELRQLRGAEELLDRGDDRADVDQRRRGDRLDVLGGHPLADDALHAAEADAHLVLDQLADAADAAVGEVVLVVEAVARLLLDEVEHVADRRDAPRWGGARRRRRSLAMLRLVGSSLSVLKNEPARSCRGRTARRAWRPRRRACGPACSGRRG